MKRLLKPSVVNGIAEAPPSKSVAQRVIAVASLARGHSEVLYPGTSDDVKATIRVCKALGTQIHQLPGRLVIDGGISAPYQPLDCGESGLGIRMFSSIAATLDKPVILTGRGTLTKRPMYIVERSVMAIGAKCKTNNGYIPITVTGPAKGGVAKVDGSLSSQVLTGMLIAAPKAKSDITLRVSNLKSKPYIDLTIDVMKTFGVEVENIDYKIFSIKSGTEYMPANYIVEGDWSGAAFLLVAGAIAGKVRVDNISLSSKQADKAVLHALDMAGATISTNENSVEVAKNKLKCFNFDATNCPDLFPPLVALASYCKGETRIKGVSRLRTKESDRAEALCQEFAKLNINIKIAGEDMIIKGGKLHGGIVESHDDHRIVMACGVAALQAKGVVEINGAEAVAKSYPEFFKDLEMIKV